MGVTPWPAPAKGIGETPDTLARGGVREPAARTVASGTKWPMRAGGQEGVNGQPLGTDGAAVAAQASDRPLQGWGGRPVPACRRGHCRGQLGGLLGSPRGIYTGGGVGTARARPVPHATRRPGRVAQLGRLRWPALAHLLTFGSFVRRAPSVAR